MIKKDSRWLTPEQITIYFAAAELREVGPKQRQIIQRLALFADAALTAISDLEAQVNILERANTILVDALEAAKHGSRSR